MLFSWFFFKNCSPPLVILRGIVYFFRALLTFQKCCSLFRNHCSLSRSVAHFPESLLTFSKINKVRYFYQTFLFQIFNYTNLILNQLLYNSILSIFNICILSTYYNKCALKSSSLISVKYAGAISNTVLHPFWPSS